MNEILQGDVLEKLRTLPDESADCIITSPPYWGLRDYGVKGQLGSEPNIAVFINNMLLVTWELKRVLKKTGTLFWNHGDSYGTASGSGVRNGIQASNSGTQTNKGWQENGKAGVAGYEKSLMLQAYRLVIQMVDEQGWILRNQIIWHKPNAMPSSVKDRFGVDFEPVFFFTKSKRYFWEKQYEDSTDRTYSPFNVRVPDAHKAKSIQYRATKREVEGADKYGINGSKFKGHSGNYDAQGNYIGIPGKRGMRTVWRIPSKGFKDAHFATFPEALIEPMVLAGCPQGGVVIDPFMGAGTTAVVAQKLGRNWLGIELNPAYVKIARERIAGTPVPLPQI